MLNNFHRKLKNISSQVEIDLSQIEFRTIVHYIQNQKCIQAYNSDPKTDFHQWTANACGIQRKPAKVINFMLGYGGGERRCIQMLKSLPEIRSTLKNEYEIEQKAREIYTAYHKALPELKYTIMAASKTLRQRGYVRTFFGRRRHIRGDRHFIAFNSVCQGTAADLMKIITLRLIDMLPKEIKLIAIVHDSWLFDMPKEMMHKVPELVKTIEYRPEGFRVPIYAEAKHSDESWSKCTT